MKPRQPNDWAAMMPFSRPGANSGRQVLEDERANRTFLSPGQGLVDSDGDTATVKRFHV